MKLKCRVAMIFLICVFVLMYIKCCFYVNNITEESKQTMNKYERPMMVWIANWPAYKKITKYCDTEMVCDIIIKDDLFDKKNVKAYLFYGSNFDHKNLPLPRESPNCIWALYHEESPRNKPILMHEKALNLFNFSSTFSRFSDCPLTLQYLSSYDDIITDKFFIKTNSKNKLLHKIAPVLYIQSDCDTMTDRDTYVKEMMKYIDVDSYGSCLQNKELPQSLNQNYLEKLNSDEFLEFVAKYKFTVSFENGICDDYITEKLWRPIIVGSIPIYLGSPTIRDWLPNPKTIINAENFSSPKELAKFLKNLNENDELYNEYLSHKLQKRVSNKYLVEMLQKWKELDNIFDVRGIEAFECFVCHKVHDMLHGKISTASAVSKMHYNCPKPISPVIKKEDNDNWWLSNWYFSRVEAEDTYKKVMEDHRELFHKNEN